MVRVQYKESTREKLGKQKKHNLYVDITILFFCYLKRDLKSGDFLYYNLNK